MMMDQAKQVPADSIRPGNWGYEGDDERGWEVLSAGKNGITIRQAETGGMRVISWDAAADQNWLWWNQR